ncbi:histidine kinase [Microbacterium sp. Root61]|uniref:ATP-binding protein n=1 Tax=Microbacterium sp. Root61 TaxID=1736570 RepID=UPI0007008FA5|nr:ATP-binding protein [Microbacterium sp. Root61]KRA25939.1 histidine kinase [Microbacterium sp. Root61]
MTVALLVIGLLAAGLGTMAFLRSTLVTSLDDQLRQSVTTDVASSVMTITVDNGVPSFEPDDNATTDAFVAIYAPTGELVAWAGGNGAPRPEFPAEYPLPKTYIQGTTPFELENSAGGAPYHASVDTIQFPGARDLYTQLVALPLAPVEQVVASFLSIYSILAVITILAGALGTRWLVTLTFRSLGQVETTAMSIAAGDFSQRMTDIEPGTEVGRLKTAINAMLGRIDGALSERDSTVRQMRRFIGDASHELRTPLVTVRGYAELYRMGALANDEDVAQAMERIEKEAMRMGVLVEDLLALARLDERRDVIFAPVDLRPIARDAALDVRAAAPRRPVTVIDTTDDALPPGPDGPVAEGPASAAEAARRRSSPPTSAIARAGGATLSLLRRKPRSGPPGSTTGEQPVVEPSSTTAAPVSTTTPTPIVFGDENRIRQVVTNLLGNARRFTAEDSPIELRVGVDATAEMGWIEVIDHGEGIPPQIRDKIFQRFWRADNSRTRETGGTGLGLSIVASIVEALHGTVGVTETPGGGATFRVALPLAQSRDASEHLLIQTQPLPRLSAPEA